MLLILHREDLNKEHGSIAMSRTRFEHLNDKAQLVVRVVGHSKMLENDGSNYNVIHAPTI